MEKLKKILLITLLLIVSSCFRDDSLPLNGGYSQINLNIIYETNWDLADEILHLINEYRTSIGLPSIECDYQYASAYAVHHTNHMIEIDYLNHDNFNERSEALKQRGATRVGENLAYGYVTASNVVSAWLNSPTHKHVIEGNYTHSGFGIIPNENGIYFFTQIFYSKD